jgi:iron complex outermembrane receptor protein
MKTRLLALVGMLAWSIPNFLLAQASIRGKINDDSGIPLMAVRIKVRGTYLMAASNSQGLYQIEGLKLKETYILEISQIGFETILDTVAMEAVVNTRNYSMKVPELMMNSVVVAANKIADNSPMTFSNITKEDIEKINFGQDIPYLLDEIPSSVVSSDAGAGVGYTGIRIRGTDPTRTNVTVNGIPINDSESHGVFWVNMPDFASSVDNIQVQRGVGTSSNGGAAFGAGIHMTTNTVNRKAYGEIENAAGSFNTLRHTVRLGTGLINNQFSLDARLSRISSDGYIDRASSDLRAFYVSGAWLKEKHSIRFNIFSGKEVTYQAWNGVFQGDLATNRRMNSAGMYTDDSGNIKYYDREVDDYHQTHYQLHYNGQISKNIEHGISLHYTRGFGFYEQFRKNDDFSTYGLSPIQIYDASSDTVLTINQTDLVRRRWLDNHFYGAVYGLTYNNSRGLQVTWGASANQYIGDHFGEIVWARYASQSDIRDRYYENRATKSEANSYIRSNYQRGKWNFFGELHYRFIDFRFTGNAVVFEEAVETNQVVNYNFFNPKAGVSYELNKHNSLYFSYAQANREPVRRDFTESTPESRPQPERLHNLEIAHVLQHQKITFKTTGYWMYYKNQLVLNGKINDVGAYTRTNVDQSYRAGLELELGYKPNKKWQLSVNTALSRNKIIEHIEFIDNFDDGSQIEERYKNADIAFSPNIIAGGRLTYTPVDQLEISIIGKFVSKQYLDNTQNETRIIDPFAYANIRVNYVIKNKLFKEIHLGLLLNNVTNSLYQNNGYTFSYVFEGQMTTENYYYPQAGINFLGSVKLRF